MERLSADVKYQLHTFCRCQLCGHQSNDICEFRMWQECDDVDKPEPDNYIVICAEGACRKRLDDHPRLYVEVPWGEGQPGMFMLLCGPCKFRRGFKCTHPNLMANGGKGLEIKFANVYPNVRVCLADGTGFSLRRNPANHCAGKE